MELLRAQHEENIPEDQRPLLVKSVPTEEKTHGEIQEPERRQEKRQGRFQDGTVSCMTWCQQRKGRWQVARSFLEETGPPAALCPLGGILHVARGHWIKSLWLQPFVSGRAGREGREHKGHAGLGRAGG